MKVGDTFRVKTGPKGEREVRKYKIIQIMDRYVICECLTGTGQNYRECFMKSDLIRRN